MSRPPHIVACASCSYGLRCEAHTLRRCPGCGGAEGPVEVTTKEGERVTVITTACAPSCPRRLKARWPEPYRAPDPPPPRKATEGFGSDTDKLNRLRAWQLLEVAAVRWLELREYIRRDERGASQRMVRLAEEEVERAAARLRAMREGKS